MCYLVRSIFRLVGCLNSHITPKFDIWLISNAAKCTSHLSMMTFSALLAICAGNSLVTDKFPSQRPVTRSFGVFFDLYLNKPLIKRLWGWWVETPSRSLWRHCNVGLGGWYMLLIENEMLICSQRCTFRTQAIISRNPGPRSAMGKSASFPDEPLTVLEICLNNIFSLQLKLFTAYRWFSIRLQYLQCVSNCAETSIVLFYFHQRCTEI